jgi:L-cysteine S-thiosulfotransferase
VSVQSGRTVAAVPRRGRSLRSPLLVAAAVFAAAAASAGIARAQTAPGAVTVVGDAIPAPLTGSGAYTGDPARGRAIVTNRQIGLCLLCHSGPFPEERFQGDVAPDLNGVGGRFSAGQLRLRMVDSGRINAATIMPAYYRIEGLTRVAPAFQGKPVLSAEQIEDVVAFLTTLRN